MSDSGFSVVVDIDAAGRHFGYSYSNGDSHLTDGDGTVRYFLPGLVSLELPELDIGGTGSNLSFSVADGAMWEEALRGRQIHDAVCRVFAVPEGITRVRDTVLLYQGVVNQLSYSETTGVLSLTAGAMDLREEQPFPPASVGDYLRFPNIGYDATTGRPTTNKDTAVPIIYGTNYEAPLVLLDDPLAGSGPAAPNRTWRYLIAGHRIQDTSIDTVLDDGSSFSTSTVSTAIDGLGGVYSYITVTEGVEVIVGEEPPEETYALVVNGKEKNGSLITGLADVLEDIWLNYGPNNTPLDYSRTTQAANYLNVFSVSVRFDQITRDSSMAEILESRFGSQFPVSFSLWSGKFGWDYIGRRQDRPPVGTITYGQDSFQRESIGTTSRGGVINAVEIEYQRSGRAAGTQEGYRLDQSNNLSCRSSVSRWGSSRTTRLSVPDASQTFSGDNNAAYLAATELLARRHDVFTEVTYLVTNQSALRWNLGDPVLVTDSGLGWDRAKFYLRGKAPSVLGFVSIKLESDLPFYARK